MRAPCFVAFALGVVVAGCSDGETLPAPPAEAPPTTVYETCRTRASVGSCGGEGEAWNGLFTPSTELEAKALAFDRLFHAVNASSTGLNTEVRVETAAGKATIDDFLAGEGFELAEPVVDRWAKVAGAYAGVGVAADAFRYGTLRDQGASCAEVDQARAHLQRDLDALHLAVAITGEAGVIARGFARKDLPGVGADVETVPLFDGGGAPLPEEKNNGTWREDNSESGAYSDYVWEDSCSRDQYVGWVIGIAAAWEIIADDEAFAVADKERLQADAAALARSLMAVRERGYDLEIRDADGRATYHGIMNENGIDRGYLSGASNGFNALMSVGIVAALAYVAEESDVFAYLYEDLIDDRDLLALARENMIGVDLGVGSNFSTYNMAFAGGYLALRYLCDEGHRAEVADAIQTSLYDRSKDRQPHEQGQTLYDFVHALATTGHSAFTPMGNPPDEGAVTRGLATLTGFPEPPYYDTERINCDETELAAGTCEAIDGSTIVLETELGWNDEQVAASPLPMSIRPPSNYHWRSNPYRVNGGGDGNALYSAVDFRFTYWLGRWAR